MGNLNSKRKLDAKKSGSAVTSHQIASHSCVSSYEWYPPAAMRAIFAIMTRKNGFLGRHIYLLIRSFLRKFSPHQLGLRLNRIVTSRVRDEDDTVTRQVKSKILGFRWRIVNDKNVPAKGTASGLPVKDYLPILF